VRALHDTGSQLTIVNQLVLNGSAYIVCDTIQIRCLFGSPVSAQLTCLTLSLKDDERCTQRVMCAVSDLIHEDLIVPANVLDSLNNQYNRYITFCSSSGAICNDNSECNKLTASIDNHPSSCDRMVADRDVSATNSCGTSDVNDFLDMDQVANALIDPGLTSVAQLQRE
jgi:hypothetical protein